jgi:hypothetical protein
MQGNTAEIGPGSAPGTPGKTRLLTLGHLDGRTRAKKRARELFAAFEAELSAGGRDLSVKQRLDIEAAAVLCAIAEDKSARSLAGEPIAVADLVKLNNAAARAVRALSLPKLKPRPPGPTLGELLRAERS